MLINMPVQVTFFGKRRMARDDLGAVPEANKSCRV